MAIKRQKNKKIVTKKHTSRQQRESKQTKIIVSIAIALGAIVLGLVIYGLANQFIFRPQTTIASVGETKIKAGEFESYVQYTRTQLINQAFQYYTFQQQFGQFGGDFLQPAISIVSQLMQPIPFARGVLDEMIDNVLVREEAERRGITVSPQEVDQALHTAFGFFPNGTLTPTVTATILPTPTYSETQLAIIALNNSSTSVAEDGGEDSIVSNDNLETGQNLEVPQSETSNNSVESENELESEPDVSPTVTVTPTPYTTQEYGRNLKLFNKNYRPYNFDIHQLREIFLNQLLRERLIEVVAQDVPLMKDEIWARHILVESNEEALQILEDLSNGEDFAALAALHSIDDSNKDKGGDLGWFDKNTMVPSFSDAAFSLQEGEISDPVESNFGFHIIQVIGRRQSQISPAELQQLQLAAFNTWLVDLRSDRDDIEINPNWEKFAPTTPEVPQQFMTELLSQGQ